MRFPASFQGPRENDSTRKSTVSQSEASNMSTEAGNVGRLLEQKGGNIISVKPDDGLQLVVDLLREKRIGAVVVLSESGDLEGILSERDIVRKLSETPGQVLAQNVSALMTRKVQVCSPSDSLIAVLRLMTEGRFRHMPVMDGGKLVGMVTIGDVVNFRLRELEHEAVQLKQMIVG
ncbi:MAG: CBS domain-containing protein [Pseudomonadota bacterium]